MKTFETEKNNIPEGATHYRNEDRHSLFTWLKVGDDIELWCDIMETWRCIGSHVNCIMDKITPIPQTKEVEWANGDDCLYMNSKEVHKFIGIDPTRNDFCYIKADCSAVNWVEVAKLSKPETEAEQVEREREEFKVEMCKDLGIDVAGCNAACIINKLYELGYRKESE